MTSILDKICFTESQTEQSKVEMNNCELCDSDELDNQADKYCVDCSQYICSKCATKHVRIKLLKDHKIVDKKTVESQTEESKLEMNNCELCDSDESEKQGVKYCVDCSQYICLKCATKHVRIKLLKEHKIVDNKKVESLIFKLPESNCYKHKQDLTTHCKKCDVLLCATCCTMYHSDHEISDNFEEVLEKSNSDILEKIAEIDYIIKNQNYMISENEAFETVFIKNFDKVHNEIEGYARELKDLIDNLTKANITKIYDIKKDFMYFIQTNFQDSTCYIASLKNLKFYVQEELNQRSIMRVFNLSEKFNINTWYGRNKPKVITKIVFSLEKLSIDKPILTDLSSLLKLSTIKELNIKLRTSPTSVSVFKNQIYTIHYTYSTSLETYQDFCIDVYNIITGKHETSIVHKQCVKKDIIFVNYFYTLETLYFYYYANTLGLTYLLKINDDTKTFVFLKKLEYMCTITSTYRGSLLARTNSDQFIELSTNGDVLKKIFKIPSNAILLSARFHFYDIAHQLKNKQYVVTSSDSISTQISLLDSEGALIKFIIRPSTNCSIRYCTDGKKYIFLLESDTGKMTVLSTDLIVLFEFNYPEVGSIYYDEEHGKVLLIRQSEVIYLTYRFNEPILAHHYCNLLDY